MRPEQIKAAVNLSSIRLSSVCRLVMLSFALSVACSVFAAGPTYPPYKGHVNDFAGVIDAATKDQLETILLNFEKRTGTQIGVVTVKTLGETPIEDYANGLYRAWGIGAKSGPNKNKGALLLVATEDRRSRLEVGYGLEGDLPDGLAGEMLRRMRPYFKQMNWSEGITVGVRTLVDTLAKKWDVSLEGIDQSFAYTGPPPDASSGEAGTSILGAICGIIVLFLFVLIAASNKRGGPRGGLRAIEPALWMGSLILNRGGGGFGGGGGGGGGGSDWGGFGGGSSGGGGASDSW